jgi:hypothetical protein
VDFPKGLLVDFYDSWICAQDLHNLSSAFSFCNANRAAFIFSLSRMNFVDFLDDFLIELFDEWIYAKDLCRLSSAFCNENRAMFLHTLQTNHLVFHLDDEECYKLNMFPWIAANSFNFPSEIEFKYVGLFCGIGNINTQIIDMIDTSAMNAVYLNSDKQCGVPVTILSDALLEYTFQKFPNLLSLFLSNLSLDNFGVAFANDRFQNLVCFRVDRCRVLDASVIFSLLKTHCLQLMEILWLEIDVISIGTVQEWISHFPSLESIHLSGSSGISAGLVYVFYSRLVTNSIELRWDDVSATDVENTKSFFVNNKDFAAITLYIDGYEGEAVELILKVMEVVVLSSPKLNELYLRDCDDADKVDLSPIFNTLTCLTVLEWTICWRYEESELESLIVDIPKSVIRLTIEHDCINTDVVTEALKRDELRDLCVITRCEIDMHQVLLVLGVKKLTLKSSSDEY